MTRPSDSRTLSDRYGEGYFHGEGSGYPTEGYEHAHASWEKHLQTAKSYLDDPVKWLEVGCAYGYLIEEAEKLDIDAIGVDISEYALHQHPPVKDRLLQGDAFSLPFADDSFDVVSAFDLVEHLEHPLAAIKEWKRVLRPNGLLFLSTPDPCSFTGAEPTHVFERPPSFWVKQFEDNGFDIVLRFGPEFYAFEICARLRDDSGEFHLPEFPTGHAEDVFPPQRNGDVFIVPRSGWGDIETKPKKKPNFRWIGEQSTLYILNRGNRPVRCRLRLRLQSDNHPDAVIDDLRLRHLPDTGKTSIHEWEPFELHTGGHVLTLTASSGTAIPVETIEIETIPFDREEYLESLPFDLYQRYRLTAEVLDVMCDSSREVTVLEVGGKGSPLPSLLPNASVSVTDVEWEDRPWFHKCDAENLPYVDGSFEFLVGCDFLEHVTDEKRGTIIEELKRVARRGVVLIGPTKSDDICEADALVNRFYVARAGREHRYLLEHKEHGLPDADRIAQLLAADNWQILGLPSGLLERWLPMQLCMTYLESVAELAPLRREVNRLYNRAYYNRDNAPPAYRTLILATSQPLSSDHRMRLEQLLAQPSDTRVSWDFASFLTELFNIDLLRERANEVGQRDKHIGELLRHAESLEKGRKEISRHAENLGDLLQSEQGEREKLTQHATDLRDHIKQMENHIGELEKDAEGRRSQWQELQSHVEELQKHADNLAGMIDAREQRITELERHTGEITGHLKATEEERERLTEQLRSQHTTHDSLLQHTSNLEQLVKEKEEYCKQQDILIEEKHSEIDRVNEARIQDIQNVEKHQAELLDHANNLRDLISQQEAHNASLIEHCRNLETIIAEKDSELAQMRDTEDRLVERIRDMERTLAFRVQGRLGRLVGGKHKSDTPRSEE